jgi:hypothetical protein
MRLTGVLELEEWQRSASAMGCSRGVFQMLWTFVSYMNLSLSSQLAGNYAGIDNHTLNVTSIA